MRVHRVRLLVLAGVLVAAAGCASTDEWRTWREHPTHFASGDHLSFSIRNTEQGTPRVNRQEIATAREEAWWGKPIVVGQEQILER